MPSSGRPDSPKLAYDAAAELGLRNGSIPTCAKTYHTCPFGYEALMAELRDDSAEF